MSIIKHTFSNRTLIVTEDSRSFALVQGEVYEAVRGDGFVAITKVVVKSDISFVLHQTYLAVEYTHV
jgi:hypothetical protein